MKIPYYVLKIFIDKNNSNLSQTLVKYRNSVKEIQEKMKEYISGRNLYMDVGFDLFTTHSLIINSNTRSNKVDHDIKCSMTFNEIPTAFYLYPRSSTGLKTPLRLSNSVGIIDSGYRGNIIAIFDNISNTNYNISKSDRLIQICGPNLMYPIYPVLVDNIEELGITSRGSGGLGSTGR